MKTPHKHAELIHAWADGAEIEFRVCNDWRRITAPSWDQTGDYRIKPEPKPDTVWSYNAFEGHLFRCHSDSVNLKLTFDGETGKLKSAEVLE